MADAHPFTDRAEAGRALAPVVATHLDRMAHHGRPVVLALPRGGVPVGYEVARAIGADLDVIVARKIGVPGQPEVGLGAVTEDGPPILDHALLRHLGLEERQIQPLVQRERAEVRRRLSRYRGDRPHPNLTDQTVVIVDDGLATGVTARAALAAARAHRPAHLVFAAPVCAPQSVAVLESEADAVLCAQTPDRFGAVGRWYDDFRQLSDADVERLLAKVWTTNAVR
jgi:putative phosphoribosyl transferase